MANYTLTYSQSSQGWVSFYSFNPDWMIGMNNYFYTFKGGNLYRHNVNSLRNNFYGVQYNSMITSVFNDVPLENKLFKTINIEGDDSWDVDMYSDIQTTGFIDASWFEKKEQSYFAFVRNNGTIPADIQEYPLRSVNGIGRSSTVTGPAAAVEVNFSISPLISIGNIASIGDYLYYALPPYTAPVYCGEITAIDQNYVAGLNRITVDTTAGPGSVPPIQTAFFFYIKNSVAESHGILGHYCVFTIENNNTDKVELFMVESEVMKSFP